MTPQITVLPNGLRVVSEERPGLLTAAVGVWVDAGSRHETAAQNGISHMLEHMAFKGTERRSALAIAQEIEDVGGYLNAYTSREQTAYYARVLKDDVPLAIDILADILQHSVFDAAELQREQEVIVQEIGQSLDTPEDIIFDYLQETAYPDQPVGRSILGTPEHVRGFDKSALNGYLATHYHAPSMVLAAVGAIDHKRLVELAEEAFGALPPSRPRAVAPGLFASGERRVTKELEQAHVTFALPGVTYGDPDYYVAQVFSNALGGGMSSRLFQEVREKRGLCYSIYSYVNAYADTGLMGVYAGTGPESLTELMPVVIGEIGAMAGATSVAETERAKAQLKAGVLMGMESSTARCEQLARQLLVHGRLIPADEIIGRVDAIDAAAVGRFAGRVGSGGAPALAAVGPVESLPAFDAIAARFTGS